MPGERIASQSEVIRAIASGYSPCCGVSHLSPAIRDSDSACDRVCWLCQSAANLSVGGGPTDSGSRHKGMPVHP